MSVIAGNPVLATIQAVDAFFNVETILGNSVSLTTSDPFGPPNAGTNNSFNGTWSNSVTFYSQGNWTVTAYDTTASKTGVSDLIPVAAGGKSTVMGLTHGAPVISAGILGQPATLMTMDFKTQLGTDPAEITDLIFHAQDHTGANINWDKIFQSIILSGPGLSATLSAPAAAYVTFGSFSTPMTVGAGATMGMTLVGLVSTSVQGSDVQVFLDSGASVTAVDYLSSGGMTVIAVGDSFPMASQDLVILSGDLKASFGNYPNPMMIGSGNTTIQFNLAAPSTVSLILYDMMGSKVKALYNATDLLAGLQTVMWDGRNDQGALVLNGVYIAELNVNGQKLRIKIAAVK